MRNSAAAPDVLNLHITEHPSFESNLASGNIFVRAESIA
jgi:hypothetical protein